MSTRRIVVIGSANIDLVTRVRRCPEPGETLLGLSFDTVPGGKGANQAVAAARLGAETLFVGCLGDDAFGRMQREALSGAGVDLTHVRTHPGEPTGTAVILVGEDGQNTIVVTPSANYGLTPADVEALEPVIREADAVALQLEIPMETVAAAVSLAKKVGTASILDCGAAQQVPAEVIEAATVVSPNETEAAAMTGARVSTIDEARHAGEKLLELGAGNVVLKLGSRGCLGWAESRVALHLPAFPIHAVDTTAAGDAFTAALAAGWGQMPLEDLLRFANAAGALAATQAGAQPSMPTRDAVDSFLSER